MEYLSICVIGAEGHGKSSLANSLTHFDTDFFAVSNGEQAQHRNIDGLACEND